MHDTASIISNSLCSHNFNFPVTSDAVKVTNSSCNPTSNFPITTDTPVDTGLVMVSHMGGLSGLDLQEALKMSKMLGKIKIHIFLSQVLNLSEE